MNRTAAVLLVGLAALAALPAASGHVTVTSVPPAGPLRPGQPAAIEVTVAVNCAIYVAEYQAAQVSTLDLALVPTADGIEPPAYLPFVGETVPFTLGMCDPASATVSSTGTITVTPSPLAPAFQPIPLQPGAVGETNEGGNLTVEVAFAWNVTVVEGGLTAGENGTLVLDVAANADAILTFTADHGLQVPAEVEVASPLLEGKATRRVEVPVKADHAGEGRVTVSAQAKGHDATGAPFALTLDVLPPVNATAGLDDGHDHGEDEEADSKGAPAPAAPLAALALLALALRRRA